MVVGAQAPFLRVPMADGIGNITYLQLDRDQ
jgi:hypothetical protein